jgi:hypothetical protein
MQSKDFDGDNYCSRIDAEQWVLMETTSRFDAGLLVLMEATSRFDVEHRF